MQDFYGHGVLEELRAVHDRLRSPQLGARTFDVLRHIKNIRRMLGEAREALLVGVGAQRLNRQWSPTICPAMRCLQCIAQV